MSMLNQDSRHNAGAEKHVAELRRLMDSRGLHVEYQAIVDVQLDRHVASEALIRGPANSDLHMPMALFATAAVAGWTHELEWLAAETAIREFAAGGNAPCLFVNMSVGCLHAGCERLVAVHDEVSQILPSRSRIVIELTEDEAVSNFSELRATLQAIRHAGFQIAIDDMGEGFSNLRLWSEVCPEYVKIDRHFISGIETDILKRSIVLAMRRIADACGSALIAEGVETAAQLKVLTEIGVPYLQGFGIGRPCRIIPAVPSHSDPALPCNQSSRVAPPGAAFECAPTDTLQPGQRPNATGSDAVTSDVGPNRSRRTRDEWQQPQIGAKQQPFRESVGNAPVATVTSF